MAKQSSSALSRLASRIMKGARATQRDIMQLAASVLSVGRDQGHPKGQEAQIGGKEAQGEEAEIAAAFDTVPMK